MGGGQPPAIGGVQVSDVKAVATGPSRDRPDIDQEDMVEIARTVARS
jgi:hypothetical protein